ncbi:type II secretion system protein GspL [Hirschia litorea]|uniref:Type II secretion system protein GspL n=1 Tax=Hirschia litorea TaxID=1199156 RepID=A0ABW2IHC3_9PROT
MANWLVAIAIESPADGCDWRLLSDKGDILTRGFASLQDLADIKHDRFVLVLPGQNVSAFRAVLNAKNDAQLRAIAPFVIEDDIAADIDGQHVSIGYHAYETRHYTLAVVSHDYMTIWQNALQEVGLVPFKILPDYFCLPKNSEHVTCLLLNNRSLYRYQDWGASFDPDVDGGLIEKIVQSAAEKWDYAGQSNTIELSEIAHDTSDSLDILAAQVVNEKFTLMQGRYVVKSSSSSNTFKQWKMPLVLAMVSVLIATGYNIAEGLTFKSETRVLSTSVTNEVRRVFPGVKRIVNARAQLKTLTAGTGQASDFLQLSGLLSVGVQEVEGISLDSLRYDARRKEIQASIMYANYEELTQFKETIEALGGSVREGGSRQVGNSRAGEITVTL